MYRLIALQIGALLLVGACSPSMSPDKGPAAPLVADTVLYVGARAPVYSLMSASGGGAYTPAPTTHVQIFGRTSSSELTHDTVSAPYSPGAVVLRVTDDVAKWVRTFRVGFVWDLPRTWQFSSLCRTAETGAVDYTNTLSTFVTTQPAALAGHPRWAADNRPSISAVATGTWTDSVFHFYLHSDNHVRPDTAVVRAGSIVNTIQSDSSMNVRYTLANGASATLPGGPSRWENGGAVFSGAGVQLRCRANLDALTSTPGE
jgi:hypothetical protein